MRLSRKFKAVVATGLIVTSAAFFSACEVKDTDKENSNTEQNDDDDGVYTGGGNDGNIPDTGNNDMDWGNNRKDYIVLSDDNIAETATEVLPVEIKDTTMTFATPTDGDYYNEKFNTAVFDATQLQEGEKYFFKGTVDPDTGRVNDRIIITGTMKNVLIEVEDAQLTFDKAYGDSQINMTVPCYGQFEYHGLLYQAFPKAPFKETPLVKFVEKTDKTDIRAPKDSKKQVGETRPKHIW